jgi:hypothetical protein
MRPEVVVARRIALLLALGLLGASCTSDDGSAGSTTTLPTSPSPTSAVTTAPPTTATTPATGLPADLAAAPFGALAEVAMVAGGDPYARGPHPASLQGVVVHEQIAAALDAAGAVPKLTEFGFTIVSGDTRYFHHIYEGAEYAGYPVFVTTDAAYHVWHLAFDKILREVEQQALLPVLEDMLFRLVDLARSQETELIGTALEAPANRVRQFFEAAATLLEIDVGPIGTLAEQEVALARAAVGREHSPTIGTDVDGGFISRETDYSLFRPRGHYTRNPDLERFFRAMSQLGNNAFLYSPEEGLQMGILASRVLLADPAVSAAWQRIYEPTAFLIGAADDYTPFELSAAVNATVPTAWDDVQVFSDLETVAAVGAKLLATRPVQINPEAASVRIMGSRFVIDSFVYDQLVIPNVTERDAASPLDLAAAAGSDWAYEIQDAAGETDYPGYDEALDSMRALLNERDIDDWGRTVYDAWLYALEPMWLPRGAEFPDFMQTPAWRAKSHQTGFGSYTELKHDTILYTKQAVAEGGGEEPPVPPRHWVEPDPVVFERLAAVTALIRTGLTSRDLLADEFVTLLDDLEEFYGWLASIAHDELAGLPISDEDNEQLSRIGGMLESFWLRASDLDLGADSGPDSHAALVADIMSNAGGVLELGTGFVDRIFVLVPDDGGDFQVAVGGVYSYYEFWNSGPRLTDEEWRVMLENGEAPPRPGWQEAILSGELAPRGSGLEPGLFCRDLDNRGYGFSAAAAYWVSEGAPDRMDADRNGVPCETVFPRVEIDAFLDEGAAFVAGLSCSALGLGDQPDEYRRAVAYWMSEGAPARMDADGDGIPCETMFSSETVIAYLMP